MGQNLDQILTQVGDGDSVNVTLASNQDNGIVGYAVGSLVFHKASGGVVIGHPVFRPARLASNPGQELQFFFSDRKLDIDPPPPPGSFGRSPRQPFNANAIEKLGMTISLGSPHVMELAVFGTKSLVTLSAMSDVLVGVGPSLGNSAAGVFTVAFTGISRPPR
jgi:hypothetical protein